MCLHASSPRHLAETSHGLKRGQAVLISLQNASSLLGGKTVCWTVLSGEGRRESAVAGAAWFCKPLFFFTARPRFGALAQMGERLICIQEVIGSIPIGSTRDRPATGLGDGSVAQVVRAHA